MERSAKKLFLALAGTIALALGVVGIVVPVLPTTPLLLLAAFCYVRSSKRLYDWLLHNRFLGPYIHDYIAYRAVKRGVKVVTLIFLWLTLMVSIIFVPNVYVRVFLIAVGIGVSVHVLRLKTLREGDAREEAGRLYPGGE